MCAEVVKVGFVQVLFSIDPLLKKLLGCANQDELTRAIQNIYRRLDADRSGGLSYHELRDELKKMDFDPPIILSEAEFDMITEGKTLCDDDEELEDSESESPSSPLSGSSPARSCGTSCFSVSASGSMRGGRTQLNENSLLQGASAKIGF